jgi:hypothetical protein
VSHAEIEQLLAVNADLRAACAEARQALALAMGRREFVTVAPVEIIPPAWAATRDAQEQRRGVSLWKFFRLIPDKFEGAS